MNATRDDTGEAGRKIRHPRRFTEEVVLRSPVTLDKVSIVVAPNSLIVVMDIATFAQSGFSFVAKVAFAANVR
jgi:hypothetical protein